TGSDALGPSRTTATGRCVAASSYSRGRKTWTRYASPLAAAVMWNSSAVPPNSEAHPNACASRRRSGRQPLRTAFMPRDDSRSVHAWRVHTVHSITHTRWFMVIHERRPARLQCDEMRFGRWIQSSRDIEYCCNPVGREWMCSDRARRRGPVQFTLNPRRQGCVAGNRSDRARRDLREPSLESEERMARAFRLQDLETTSRRVYRKSRCLSSSAMVM